MVQLVEGLKRFKTRCEILLHRPHLNPWNCAFWPLVIHSAAFSQQLSLVTLNVRSRHFVDPLLLNLHLSPELSESGSAELWREVQQIVAAG